MRFLSSRQGCDAASRIALSPFCSALAHFTMRFLEGGADIPNDLIRAVTEGSAVFLCGAGVSMRVRMPSFKGLTEQVYQKLGEVYTNEPAECRAFERGEYDRALRSLEKRTHQPGTPSRVRVAVAELLYAAPGIRAPFGARSLSSPTRSPFCAAWDRHQAYAFAGRMTPLASILPTTSSRKMEAASSRSGINPATAPGTDGSFFAAAGAAAISD
jgi:hypothetical protein